MKNLFIRSATVLTIATFVALSSCNNAPKTADPKTDSTATTEAAAVPAATGQTGTLIGAWHDESIKSEKGESIAYELISSGEKHYIQAITFVGTNLKLNDTPPVTPSASELKKDGDKYTSVERPAEYYQIDKAGDLLIYDGTEMVAKCKKLI